MQDPRDNLLVTTLLQTDPFWSLWITRHFKTCHTQVRQILQLVEHFAQAIFVAPQLENKKPFSPGLNNILQKWLQLFPLLISVCRFATASGINGVLA
jgi:hypothetical protein